MKINAAQPYSNFLPGYPAAGRAGLASLAGETDPASQLPTVNTVAQAPQTARNNAESRPGVDPSAGELIYRNPARGSRPANTAVDPPNPDTATPSTAADSASKTSADRAEATQQAQQQKAQQAALAQLRAIDQAVHIHEAAHAAVGGQYAGAPSFHYMQGPDGQRYAVGGEVPIDTSKVPGDPKATLMKANMIRAAALAPADPSPQDRAVAAAAVAMALEAQQEIQAQQAPTASASKGKKSAEADAAGATDSEAGQRGEVSQAAEPITAAEQNALRDLPGQAAGETAADSLDSGKEAESSSAADQFKKIYSGSSDQNSDGTQKRTEKLFQLGATDPQPTRGGLLDLFA